MGKNKMDPGGGSGGLLLTGWSLPRHAFDTLMTLYRIATALLLVIPAYLIYRKATRAETSEETSADEQEVEQEPQTIMQPARTDLDPPKDDPFTLEQLREFDGSDASKPVYVSIKGAFQSLYDDGLRYRLCFDSLGTVFDVSRKRETYGVGGSYNVFAGKDGSRGLGMSSLKTEDAVPDYSTLPESDMKVLNDWHSFFSYVRPILLHHTRFSDVLDLGNDTTSSAA